MLIPVLVLALVILIYLIWKKRKRNESNEDEEIDNELDNDSDDEEEYDEEEISTMDGLLEEGEVNYYLNRGRLVEPVLEASRSSSTYQNEWVRTVVNKA